VPKAFESRPFGIVKTPAVEMIGHGPAIGFHTVIQTGSAPIPERARQNAPVEYDGG
jgi:hypothetical protein